MLFKQGLCEQAQQLLNGCLAVACPGVIQHPDKLWVALPEHLQIKSCYKTNTCQDILVVRTVHLGSSYCMLTAAELVKTQHGVSASGLREHAVMKPSKQCTGNGCAGR